MEDNVAIPHSCLLADYAFLEEHFPQTDLPGFPDKFCSLKNENLFPIEKFVFLQQRPPATRASWMKTLEPALLLISRIVLEKPASFGLFLMRKETDEGFVKEEDEVVLSQEAAINLIRRYIPKIDIDPDISERDAFAYTCLLPSQDCDTLYMDYALFKLAGSTGVRHTVRIAALFAIAAFIGHELSHAFEFRCVRQGMLRKDGQPFETPLGATCGEAGTTWERKCFGGKIHPICEREGHLDTLRGLVVQSDRWNYYAMKLEAHWMIKLFSEDHWKTDNPLQYPKSMVARGAFLADAVLRPLEDNASPTKKRRRGGDVVVNQQPRVPRRARRCIRVCGGKVLGEDGGAGGAGKTTRAVLVGNNGSFAQKTEKVID